MGSRLTPVALDIETTGFETDDIVTVIGFALPLGCRVFLTTNNSQTDVESIQSEMSTIFETTVNLSAHDTEQEMLESVIEFSTDSLEPREYLLVAYNGERWRGGFDLPFLRSRCAQLGLQWPFNGLPYADLMPIFERRFNTTLDDKAVTDLERVYSTLLGGGLTVLDPFANSSEAVQAFCQEDLSALVQHNIADILRTDALARLAEQYCSKSEFGLKSLTPTIRDPTLQ